MGLPYSQCQMWFRPCPSSPFILWIHCLSVFAIYAYMAQGHSREVMDIPIPVRLVFWMFTWLTMLGGLFILLIPVCLCHITWTLAWGNGHSNSREISLLASLLAATIYVVFTLLALRFGLSVNPSQRGHSQGRMHWGASVSTPLNF